MLFGKKFNEDRHAQFYRLFINYQPQKFQHHILNDCAHEKSHLDFLFKTKKKCRKNVPLCK